MRKERKIDKFFYDSFNQIFLNPSKTAYVMDGSIGIGKSSNFVMLGAYIVAQSVEPIKKGNRWVRESKWASIRESEQSSLSTILQLIGESIFSPEVMAMPKGPVKQTGSHPTKVTINHILPDNTYLEMVIECHGFNNKQAHNRLRTHEFLGAMIFEMQGIPFEIFEVAMQRCGRYRTQDLVISREIDGVKHTLTGIQETAIVLCDINIPERPHKLYDRYYDVTDKSKLPYIFLTPPSPLLYKPINEVPSDKLERLKERYPITRFEGQDVIWLPNPKAYYMTKHFEKRDANGNNVAWTGYSYWFDKIHLTDSEIRRYILGKPDKVGGDSAVYQNFVNDETTVVSKEINSARDIWVGYDPGGHASFNFAQTTPKGGIHIFKEMFFEPSDRVSVRKQITDYFIPYCEKHLAGHKIIIVPDPASSWLGKSTLAGQTESVLMILRDELANIKEPKCTYVIEPCRVQNQDVTGRINGLGYFIDKGLITIDPSCKMVIAGLVGGYAKKVTKSGIISDIIDKDSIYSHSVEAVQYVSVNILYMIKRGIKRANKGSRSAITKVRTRR